MKRLTPLLVLSLAALPGCSIKEKKEQPEKTESVKTAEPIRQYVESPDDTTLPTKTKGRNSFLDETNNSPKSE